MKNYTPLFDALTTKYGIVTAAVYGYIYRKCQLDGGACFASFQTISNDLGLSRRTAVTHVKLLIEYGLIVDLTPNLDRKPHKYVVQETQQAREINALVDKSTREINALALGQEMQQLGQEMQQTREINATTRAGNAPKDIYNNNIITPQEAFAMSYFSGASGLPVPQQSSAEYNDNWLTPARAIVKRCSDQTEIEDRIDYAIRQMWGESGKTYTIRSMKSILTFAMNYGKGNGAKQNGATDEAAQAFDYAWECAVNSRPDFEDGKIKDAVMKFGWPRLKEWKADYREKAKQEFIGIYNGIK